jgi:hypothetical protein
VLSLALAAALAATVLAAGAQGARGFKKGFYDEAVTLGYPDDFGYRLLDDLGADILRMNLYWNQVATSRPDNPTNPNDPAYDWSKWDEALERAERYDIEVMLSIFGTPRWANGGKSYQYAPRDFGDLRAFAEAAGKRYPQVRLWLAWNEPNAPNFLKPQSVKRDGRWVFTSPGIYANICNAIVQGLNAARSANKVACGVLNPNGELVANGGKRESVAPVTFLNLMKAAGARPEAIAAHLYPYSPRIAPGQRVKSRQNVPLGNVGTLIQAINRNYGKGMRLWVTEYGYQTNPPDARAGVSWKTQATYLTQAFDIMRKNPRIDIGLWFMLLDDSRLEGWQSGVMTNSAKRKPSYAAFKALP